MDHTELRGLAFGISDDTIGKLNKILSEKKVQLSVEFILRICWNCLMTNSLLMIFCWLSAGSTYVLLFKETSQKPNSLLFILLKIQIKN